MQWCGAVPESSSSKVVCPIVQSFKPSSHQAMTQSIKEAFKGAIKEAVDRSKPSLQRRPKSALLTPCGSDSTTLKCWSSSSGPFAFIISTLMRASLCPSSKNNRPLVCTYAYHSYRSFIHSYHVVHSFMQELGGKKCIISTSILPLSLYLSLSLSH